MEKLANNWREKLALDKKKNLNSKLINEYGLRLLCYRYFIIVEYFTSRFNLEGFCSSQIIFSMLFFFWNRFSIALLTVCLAPLNRW